jgi:hypothetical protein
MMPYFNPAKCPHILAIRLNATAQYMKHKDISYRTALLFSLVEGLCLQFAFVLSMKSDWIVVIIIIIIIIIIISDRVQF